MFIDTTKQLFCAKGQPVTIDNENNNISDVLYYVLAVIPDEGLDLSIKARKERKKLTDMVMAGGEVDLSEDDANLILEKAAKILSPRIFNAIYSLLGG